MQTRQLVPIVAATIALLCLATGHARAQDAGPSAAAATAPAPAAGEKLPDVLDGAVDPFDSAAQRAIFYKAAGLDSELTKEEFEAAAGKDGAFVRKFDSWRLLAAFDKDSSGKLSWFEAEEYRKAVRTAVLEQFDSNKDGRLAGAERTTANEFLHAGRLRLKGGARPVIIAAPDAGDGEDPVAGNGDRTGPDGRNGDGRGWEARRAELVKKYDTDGDGQLTDEERKAMMDDFRRQREKEDLDRYDSDGDGQLSADERKAMQKDRAGEMAQMAEQVEQLKLRHFDADGDGKLDEKEKADLKEFEKGLKKIGKAWELAQFDLDGDGEVTREERQEAAKAWRGSTFKAIAKMARYADADGDGKVTSQEQEALGRRFREKVMGWAEGRIGQSDRNADGKLLDPEERKDFIDSLDAELAKRRVKADADKDGRLSPDEIISLLESFAREIGIEPPTTAPAAERN